MVQINIDFISFNLRVISDLNVSFYVHINEVNLYKKKSNNTF